MKLYLISQTEKRGYDTYDSAVVAANSEEEAVNIHPANYNHWDIYSWCQPKDVKVELIGTAVEGTEKGVIAASFNAG
jgi:hypothetical protein